MHRAILLAWLPLVGWLLAAALGVWLVARMSGARFSPARLRRLHHCEAGSVQTLSFILTLPVFIMLVMFIVQVAELMMGIAIVNYAAFAAARAACVWLPAQVPAVEEEENRLYPESLGGGQSVYPQWMTRERELGFSSGPLRQYWKYHKVWAAAAEACLATSPSRNYYPGDDAASDTFAIISALASTLAPASTRYPQFDRVIRRKANYAAATTRIVIRGIDRDGTQGPTYNPYPGYYVRQIDPSTGQSVDVWIPWNVNEIGWEDPITVTVNHYFALLPGPGQFLAKVLTPQDGTRDTVSGLIVRPGDRTDFGFSNSNPYRPYVRAVELSASATISNEGLKSVMPYAHPSE